MQIARRNFAKYIASLIGGLCLPKIAAATPLEQRNYMHPKLGAYKRHEIFRVMTPAWANPAMDSDGNLIWPEQLMEQKPVTPHYDNMIVEYENGFDIYFKREHNPLANEVISKMSGVELHKYATKSIFVFDDNDIVFFWGQRYKNVPIGRQAKLL